MRAVASYASPTRILAMHVLVGPVVLPVWEVAAVCSQPHLGLKVSEMKLGVSSCQKRSLLNVPGYGLPNWEVSAVHSQPHLSLKVNEIKLGVSSC